MKALHIARSGSISASAGELIIPEPPELITLSDFPGGSLPGGWTANAGTWATDVNGWLASSAGSAGGTTYIHTPMPEDVTYMEADLWIEGTGTNWVTMRLNHVSGALLYADGAYGALFRPNGTVAATFAGVTVEGTPPSTPTSVGTAVTMGVLIESPTSYSVWVDSTLVATATGVTAAVGTKFAIGAFNSTKLHLDAVRYY